MPHLISLFNTTTAALSAMGSADLSAKKTSFTKNKRFEFAYCGSL
jgi:hypothetical protein